MKLVNERTGATVASAVEIADTSAKRRRGLLGRDHLPSGSALVLTRCNAIHTIGMRFPIDVAFVDSKGRVRKVVHALGPWRMAISPLAVSAIELAAGELRDGLQVGDRIQLVPHVEALPR
jgi:uncharacterized membrane protein (UPF0127 family)